MSFGFKVTDFYIPHKNSNPGSESKSDIKETENDDGASDTVAKQMKSFAEKTSCHGFTKIAEHETAPNNWHRWKNAIWLALTLLSFGMACHSLIQIIDDYSSYPTSTLMKKEYEDPLQFPSVTFCNLNMAVTERLLILEEFEVFRNILDQETILTWSEMNSPNSRHRISSAFNFLSSEEKGFASHALEDMLLYCQFEGQPCNTSDFYPVYTNQNYGMCYSFNYGYNRKTLAKEEIKIVEKTGMNQGLVLILDIESDLYMPKSDAVGIILLVHKPRIFPYMEEEGIVLAPGFLTSIGLAMEETIEAEPPFGRCITEHSREAVLRNMYSRYGVGYTTATCVQSCKQAHIIRECGCCDMNAPCNPSGFKEMFGIKFPNPTGLLNCSSSEESVCMLITLFRVTKSVKCEIKCPSECKKISYDIKQSTAVWPNKMLASTIFREMNGSSRLENASADKQLSFLRENVMKIDVHFTTRSKTVTVTQPAYTWSVLLSNIGGQLGLWLGFSLLTAFEFLELLLDILVIQSLKMAYRRFNFKATSIKGKRDCEKK